METRLEIELRKKLISECLKWEVELKRLERGWRVKETRNLIIKRNNKVLESQLLVLRKPSLDVDYKKVLKIKACQVMLRNNEDYEENKFETSDLHSENSNQLTPVDRKFKCQNPGCDREYKDRISLKQHLNVHTKKYQCQDCQKCFPKPSRLYNHRRIHNKNMFECNLIGCGQRFNVIEDLKTHIKLKHSSEKQYVCTGQQNQKANKQVTKQFKCQHPGCDKKFAHKESLNHHMNVHNKRFQCKKCQKCFNSLANFQIHFRCLHTGKRPFVCNWEGCGLRFKLKGNLRKHMKITHSNVANDCNEKPFHCNQNGCARSFKSEKSLETHLQNHLVFRPFQCQLQGCGKRFKKAAHLTNHLKMHKRMLNDEELRKLEKLSLEVDDEKVIGVNEFQVFIVDPEKNQDVGSNESNVLKCLHPGCEKTFKNKIQYNCHINIHTTKYQCQHCQKCLKSLTHLKNHLRIHTGEKPFECKWDRCGKRFRTKRQLDIHKNNKHSDERPFKCPQNGCGKSFKIRRALKLHLQHHSTDRPYQCQKEGCDKKFKTSADLNQHVNYFHSDVRNFKCDFEDCEKSFKTRGDLKQHKRTHK